MCYVSRNAVHHPLTYQSRTIGGQGQDVEGEYSALVYVALLKRLLPAPPEVLEKQKEKQTKIGGGGGEVLTIPLPHREYTTYCCP